MIRSSLSAAPCLALLAILPFLSLGCAQTLTRGHSSAPLRDLDTHWAADVIDPITAPYQFESPLIHTSVRPIAIYHSFGKSNSPLGAGQLISGGQLRAFALQARYAVTDRLAVIATKDGRVKANFGSGGALSGEETGWVDIAGGVKYAVIDDEEQGTLITVGLTFETTAGDRDVFQGNGEGLWRPFVSGLWASEDINVIASVAASLPVDGSAESQSVDYHLHLSPTDSGNFVPLIEINGIHYTDGGRALGVNFEGIDYANLGAALVEGNDLITAAVGFRYLTEGLGSFGLAYEKPVTSRSDLFGERITGDWVIRF